MRVTEKLLTETFETLRDVAIRAGVSEAERWHLTMPDNYRAANVWLAHPDYARAMTDNDFRENHAESGWSAEYTSAIGAHCFGETKGEAYVRFSAMIRAYRTVIESLSVSAR